MLKIYTYKNCSTCKKATQWLRTNGLTFDEHPIRDTPPTPAELNAMLGYLEGNLRKLFNSSGQDYRDQGLKDRIASLTNEEAISLLSGNGNLIKRPFLLADHAGTVGFKEDIWRQLLLV